MVTVNSGREPTFCGRGAGSIVDLTFVSGNLAQHIIEWTVLCEENGSDHQYIVYNLGHQMRADTCFQPQEIGWLTSKGNVGEVKAGLMYAE